MNNCLSNLRNLIPDVYLKKVANRVEKTEIIEMAIGYIMNLTQTNKLIEVEKVSIAQSHYKMGFSACLKLILRYLLDNQNVVTDKYFYTKICSYIQSICTNIPNNSQPLFNNNPYFNRRTEPSEPQMPLDPPVPGNLLPYDTMGSFLDSQSNLSAPVLQRESSESYQITPQGGDSNEGSRSNEGPSSYQCSETTSDSSQGGGGSNGVYSRDSPLGSKPGHHRSCHKNRLKFHSKIHKYKRALKTRLRAEFNHNKRFQQQTQQLHQQQQQQQPPKSTNIIVGNNIGEGGGGGTNGNITQNNNNSNNSNCKTKNNNCTLSSVGDNTGGNNNINNNSTNKSNITIKNDFYEAGNLMSNKAGMLPKAGDNISNQTLKTGKINKPGSKDDDSGIEHRYLSSVTCSISSNAGSSGNNNNNQCGGSSVGGSSSLCSSSMHTHHHGSGNSSSNYSSNSMSKCGGHGGHHSRSHSLLSSSLHSSSHSTSQRMGFVLDEQNQYYLPVVLRVTNKPSCCSSGCSSEGSNGNSGSSGDSGSNSSSEMMTGSNCSSSIKTEINSGRMMIPHSEVIVNPSNCTGTGQGGTSIANSNNTGANVVGSGGSVSVGNVAVGVSARGLLNNSNNVNSAAGINSELIGSMSSQSSSNNKIMEASGNRHSNSHNNKLVFPVSIMVNFNKAQTMDYCPIVNNGSVNGNTKNNISSSNNVLFDNS